jgi:hypothetical protein
MRRGGFRRKSRSCWSCCGRISAKPARSGSTAYQKATLGRHGDSTRRLGQRSNGRRLRLLAAQAVPPGTGRVVLLRLSTRDRRRQVDQFSAVLLRIRVLGPLSVQEKVFGRIRKFVATGQDRPLMGNPQINRFRRRRRALFSSCAVDIPVAFYRNLRRLCG